MSSAGATSSAGLPGPARLYCSGGCAANAYHATGSVTGVYEKGCELFKKRMECAIMLEVAKGDTEN